MLGVTDCTVTLEAICYMPDHKSICFCAVYARGTTVAQWLRCCATIRKVAGSIPVGVSGFFVDIKSFQ